MLVIEDNVEYMVLTKPSLKLSTVGATDPQRVSQFGSVPVYFHVKFSIRQFVN